ncbi:MAG: saccharopine dehydrogenase NADP-binding domain-containing protein [Deltaproteobacteria bacterium]|nr:MAG: saccharopine dehydrogenase NADP-binding domain-containing protein [Deltaproteobacteria bacterium]
MRIIVLGGAGDMGSRAVEDLAVSDGVGQVTIADRNVETAEKLSARLKDKGAKVDVRRIDANDHQGLVEAIRGYDVAASALGPFHQFEAKLVRAAVEAGVDYASICDEWQAADSVINEFSEDARKQGVTVVTGLGVSPGISNLGVLYLSQQLDRVRRADICVYMPLNAGGGEAVIRHTLFIMAGEVALWRDGKRIMIPACKEERVVEFPRYGPQKLWNMGHSEPVTVPRFIPGIEEVNFFMGFGQGSNWLVFPSRSGLFESKMSREVLVRLLNLFERIIKTDEPGWGAVKLDVWGEAGGKEEHRMACGIGQMREATGVSLAIGTLMLARKEILTEEGGVYAPEGCLEPQKFLNYMKTKGVTAYYDLEMTKPVI